MERPFPKSSSQTLRDHPANNLPCLCRGRLGSIPGNLHGYTFQDLPHKPRRCFRSIRRSKGIWLLAPCRSLSFLGEGLSFTKKKEQADSFFRQVPSGAKKGKNSKEAFLRSGSLKRFRERFTALRESNRLPKSVNGLHLRPNSFLTMPIVHLYSSSSPFLSLP